MASRIDLSAPSALNYFFDNVEETFKADEKVLAMATIQALRLNEDNK